MFRQLRSGCRLMIHSDNIHQFLSISLLAGPGVLAPRPETELLGQVGLNLLDGAAAPRVIDMCCGSGNLGLLIAHERPDARVFLSDLTLETVSHARRNAERLGLVGRVTIGQGDLFAGIASFLGENKVDLIVCNPPYISSGKLAGEAAHLLEKEPREAFDGGAYGISIHQRLIADAPAFLRPGGWLAFEFGLGQDRQVAMLLKRDGRYGAVQFAEDAEGHPRVARAQLAGAP